MKRYLSLLMVILFPYFVPAFAAFGLFIKPLGEIMFAGEGALLLVFWLFMYIIALINSLLVLIISLIKKRDSQEMLRISMTVKLLHFPAYIVILIIALICLRAPLLSGFFVFLNCTITFPSGLVGVGGLIRGFCEKRLTLRMAIVHGLFQFIILADVVSSISVFIKVKFTAEKQGCGGLLEK